MSVCAKYHLELDELGEGKCSVPMWSNDLPSGFCDKRAFGEPPPSPRHWSEGRRRHVRADNRYDGYVPGLACSGHGGPDARVFRDGSAWCAVRANFVNLAESLAGFGDSREQAVANLAKAEGSR